MSRYKTNFVGLVADFDHGEGSVLFRWPDDRLGHDELRIFLNGHCSRQMAIHSGDGPPDFVELRRDSVKIRFTPNLAAKLDIDEQIEIFFRLGDIEFAELRRLVDHFGVKDP